MKCRFEITSTAHRLQSGKDVFISESGSFLEIHKRLRQIEKRHDLEIDNIRIESITIRENK